ncbi:MAG TPA: hypothetical protein VJ842_14380 [Pyrinomonadaceae bacterium]|nr:hypothetical protein [Pyrinomonadaceae bacterium]
MIGTALIEALVQSVALSHRIDGYDRASLLLLAAPESGKTTIATAANCAHVCRISVITGKSVLRELKEHQDTEFLLFNDLATIRGMSHQATALLVALLNQLTQGENGMVAFAGRETEQITRPIGVIGCIPFTAFTDHRSKWREMGFISRMIPFAYSYPYELIARIKDAIDGGSHAKKKQPTFRAIHPPVSTVSIACSETLTKDIRHLADARAQHLEQIGIRLLANYHSLIRAHALRDGRRAVSHDDMEFLRSVDSYVSIMECKELERADHPREQRKAK